MYRTLRSVALSLLLVPGAIDVASEGPGPGEANVRTLREIWHTSEKSQGRTGMCWAFSTISFLESELKRLGRGEFELSQPFVVYHAYVEKAMRYVYRQGGGVFGQGGLPHDVLYVVRKHGLVPASEYRGLPAGSAAYDHREMFDILQGLLKGVIKAGKGGYLRAYWGELGLEAPWLADLHAVLDHHMGAPPYEMAYKGRVLTPLQFAEEVLRIPFDDYVEITSYSYLPFYGKGELLLHDNWLHYREFYNVPLEELVGTIDHALSKGYSLVFDLHTTKGIYEKGGGFARLSPELEGGEIDQRKRDTMLADWSTTDQHLVHGIGLAREEGGERLFMVKDSWGLDQDSYEPIRYLSENFVRAKALFVLLHKDALPADLAEKLGLE